MNQQLLALQGIANGSDEWGNLLLLDRNEQRDELVLITFIKIITFIKNHTGSM